LIILTQKANKAELDASLKTSISPNAPVSNLRKFISEYFSRIPSIIQLTESNNGMRYEVCLPVHLF